MLHSWKIHTFVLFFFFIYKLLSTNTSQVILLFLPTSEYPIDPNQSTSNNNNSDSTNIQRQVIPTDKYITIMYKRVGTPKVKLIGWTWRRTGCLKFDKSYYHYRYVNTIVLLLTINSSDDVMFFIIGFILNLINHLKFAISYIIIYLNEIYSTKHLFSKTTSLIYVADVN